MPRTSPTKKSSPVRICTDDSSGLFRNIFLTEPALYGVTVRKTW